MKCSGSPTTCTAPEAARDATRVLVAATVFRELLKPVAAALGPASDVALAPLAEELARRAVR